MTEIIAKRDFKYRLYFRLMDACLLFGLLGLVDHLLGSFGIHFADGEHPIWYVALGAVTLAMNFLLAPFLILAGFMRDEYAELLWKRTTNVIVTVVTILPLGIVGLGVVSVLTTGSRTLPAFLNPLLETATWISAITLFWLAFCLLFVAIFQCLRWKDSR
ncbi:hypothetical protein KUW15_08045 [Qipengyuania aquimaris]|uniref:hypothetical protein n=1 Tax=Qipengyuania aquimaris TaxID=255984 RepID=UPI001C94CA45|nr:hypothetical protein [Qipengyuania aquimaris]MBY6128661.1 hypothetical protein [Qipengyuania aquimaris]